MNHAWTVGMLRSAITERATIWGWHAHAGDQPALRELPGRASAPGRSSRLDPRWPGLTLARRRDRRLIFAELLSAGPTAALSPLRRQVLDVLRALEWDAASCERQIVEAALGHPVPVIQTFVWRPNDLLDGAVDEALR